MSHAYGQVIKDDRIVAYFEYNGTCDVAISHVYDTDEEVSKNWRSGKWSNCHCGKEPEDVILYADYGGGFHWNAKVCFECRAIVSGRDPWQQRVADFPGHGFPASYFDLIPPTDGHPLD